MKHYQKTPFGLQALQQRDTLLNARQRRVLILIGTEDFEHLTDQFKQRLATPEILEQLIEWGMIELLGAPKMQNLKTIETESENPFLTAVSRSDSILTEENTVHSEYSFDAQSFNEVRAFMVSLLERYCGLMAKQLIRNIEMASDLHSLKRCQTQWITALQESRIEPTLLTRHLQQINRSWLKE